MPTYADRSAPACVNEASPERTHDKPAMRDRKETQSSASVFVAVSLGKRVLFDRIKFAMEFGDHQFEPLA